MPYHAKTLLGRLDYKTNKSGPKDCWHWNGAKNREGYGIIVVNYRHIGAHRVAYELNVGPIPMGMQIDHLCRNHDCVNPEHLEVVTQAENMRRGIGATAINARKTHCKHGHEFTPENIYRRPNGRECMTCLKERNAKNGRTNT